MTDTYAHGEIKQTISVLCKQNPNWTTADLRRATGLELHQVRTAYRALRIKPAPILPMIAIDKNIPMPNPKRGRNKKYNYPWQKMEVGDSFLYPPHVNYGTARGNVERMIEKLGRKFALRTTPEGLRCWRTA